MSIGLIFYFWLHKIDISIFDCMWLTFWFLIHVIDIFYFLDMHVIDILISNFTNWFFIFNFRHGIDFVIFLIAWFWFFFYCFVAWNLIFNIELLVNQPWFLFLHVIGFNLFFFSVWCVFLSLVHAFSNVRSCEHEHMHVRDKWVWNSLKGKFQKKKMISCMLKEFSRRVFEILEWKLSGKK